MKKIILGLITLVFIACSMVKEVHKKSVDIVGTWCLTSNQINYPTITFRSDSFVTLGSKMDTVYSHKYFMREGEIHFVLSTSKISVSKILKLTPDSLVLETLLENQAKQVYYRCNK